MYFILIILALQNNRNEVEFPVIRIYKHCVCQKCPGGISVLDGKVDLVSLHSLKSLVWHRDDGSTQSESYIPSSTILFPLSVITRMRGSWLAMSAWMTWCLFRRFFDVIRSLPTEKQ